MSLMSKAFLVSAALAVLFLLAAAPGATAHGAPEILDVEVLLHEDPGDDGFDVRDGYDLFLLYGREANLYGHHARGAIFRLELYGGDAPAPQATAFRIEMDVDMDLDGTPSTITIERVDGHWTSEATIMEEREDGLAFQVFVPLPAGATGSHAVVTALRSYADDLLVDEAPDGTAFGPTELHGVGGDEPMAPWTLRGPVGYLNATWSDGELALSSLITKAGQHVLVRPAAEDAGWTVAFPDGNNVELAPGGKDVLPINVTTVGHASLALEVYTDLGGFEVVYLHPDGEGFVVATTQAPIPTTEPTKESSAPAVALVALAFIAAAVARRGRREH